MKKLENFEKAFENLKDVFNYAPPYTPVIIVGLTGLFSICFEQSWKVMKLLLEYNGNLSDKIGSPRSIIKAAFQAGIIDNEDIWLDALMSRNLIAHTYDEESAVVVIEKIKSDYYKMFEDLKITVKKEFPDGVQNNI